MEQLVIKERHPWEGTCGPIHRLWGCLPPLKGCVLIIYMKFDRTNCPCLFKFIVSPFTFPEIWHYSLPSFLATPGYMCLTYQVVSIASSSWFSGLFCNLKTRMYLHSKQTKIQQRPNLPGLRKQQILTRQRRLPGWLRPPCSYPLPPPRLTYSRLTWLRFGFHSKLVPAPGQQDPLLGSWLGAARHGRREI